MSLFLEAPRSLRRLSWPSVIVLVLTSVASASLFSVADPLLLAPIPFPRADELISIAPPLDLSRRLKPPELARLAEELRQSPLLDSSSSVRPGSFDELPGGSADQGVTHHVVGPAFFETLGIRPIRGRTLTTSRSMPLHVPVVIRESLWARLGRDPSIVGRTVSIGKTPVQVIGIVADTSAFPVDTSVWSAADRDEVERNLPTIARMRPGVTVAQVRSRFPELIVRPLEDIIRPRQRLTLWLVLASAVAMALIGWLQLSALRLSRLISKSRELAVRIACGASARRVRAELAIDTAVHVLVAVSVVLFALPIAAALVSRFIGSGFPEWNLQRPGLRSYVYACLITAGAASAAHVAAVALLEKHLQRSLSLRQAGEWSLTPLIRRTRTWLLFLQVAVTVSVLYGTTLASVSYAKTTSVPLGYEPTGVFGIAPANLNGAALSERIAYRSRLQQSADRLRIVPGVLRVTTAFRRPLQTGAMKGTLQIPERPACKRRTVRTNYVDPHYFQTLSIAILEGRTTGAFEHGAVVDQRLARELAECGAGIGDLLQVTSHRMPIVGIVSTVAENLGGPATEPLVYLPDVFGMAETVLIRTDGSAAALSAAREILAADIGASANVAVFALQDDWRRHAAPSRARLSLLAAIALLSSALALVGIAGSVAQFARLRRREIAIRVALGASASAIQKGLVGSVVGVVFTGTIAGAAGGAAASRVVASQWSGAQWLDTSLAVGLSVSFAVVGLLIAAIPASRARSAAPLSLLRNE